MRPLCPQGLYRTPPTLADQESLNATPPAAPVPAPQGPDRGIIPRTVEDIFTYIVNDPEPTRWRGGVDTKY